MDLLQTLGVILTALLGREGINLILQHYWKHRRHVGRADAESLRATLEAGHVHYERVIATMTEQHARDRLWCHRRIRRLEAQVRALQGELEALKGQQK